MASDTLIIPLCGAGNIHGCPISLGVSIDFMANNNCNGENSGSIVVSANGGTPPFTYSWSPSGGTDSIATGLSAGTYTVIITDSNSLSTTATVIITQPAPLTVTAITIAHVRCTGGSDGISFAMIIGGTAPYTYLWNDANSQSTDTATALSAGIYTVTVSDSCGASVTSSVTITQPNILHISSNVIKNISCNGLTDGRDYVFVIGGTMPYSYSWSDRNRQTTIAATGLSIGTYTVMVSDSCGSSVSASVIITQPTMLIATAFAQNNVSCYGDSDGFAKVSMVGGVFPYTYSWSPNTSSTYLAPGLSIGTYSVNVMDNNGCNATSQVIITQPAILRDSLASILYPACNGGMGSASIGVKGGTSPYSFTWSPNVSSSAAASGLAVRSYVVLIKDSNGCYNHLNFTITQPTAIRVSLDSLPDNGTCSGSAWAVITGGGAPYSYLWTGGFTTDTISTLCAGYYCFTLTDEYGCVDRACVNVNSNIATGTNEVKGESEKVKVFPNPSNGKFNVIASSGFADEAISLNIEVYNVLGEKILTETLRSAQGDNLIDLSAQPDGVYFYRVLKDSGSLIVEGKLIIQK